MVVLYFIYTWLLSLSRNNENYCDSIPRTLSPRARHIRPSHTHTYSRPRLFSTTGWSPRVLQIPVLIGATVFFYRRRRVNRFCFVRFFPLVKRTTTTPIIIARYRILSHGHDRFLGQFATSLSQRAPTLRSSRAHYNVDLFLRLDRTAVNTRTFSVSGTYRPSAVHRATTNIVVYRP